MGTVEARHHERLTSNTGGEGMKEDKRKIHLVKEGTSEFMALILGYETACGLRGDYYRYTVNVRETTCKKCMKVARGTRPELFT